MATQTELLATYTKELDRLKVKVDGVLLKAVVKSLGPAVYGEETSRVATNDKLERRRIRENFMVRRLGLQDGPPLDTMLAKAIERMGSGRKRHRAVLYYLITTAAKREAALL